MNGVLAKLEPFVNKALAETTACCSKHMPAAHAFGARSVAWRRSSASVRGDAPDQRLTTTTLILLLLLLTNHHYYYTAACFCSTGR